MCCQMNTSLLRDTMTEIVSCVIQIVGIILHITVFIVYVYVVRVLYYY